MSTLSSLSRAFAAVSPKWREKLNADLFAAAVAGDPEKVWADMSRLIAKGADINATDNGTPLFCRVCERGLDGIAAKMLEAGVDPDMKDSRGATPFLLATGAGWPKVMALLADAGADMHAARQDGTNALSILINCAPIDEKEQPRFREAYELLGKRAGLSMDLYLQKHALNLYPNCAFLEPEVDGAMRLGKAAATGDAAEVRRLLDAGVKPDCAGRFAANRALYDAIAGGHAEIVAALVEAGANVKRAFARDSTQPLALAAKSGSIEVFKTLLDAGADPTKPLIIHHLNGGKTEIPLADVAITHKHPELAAFIETSAKDWAKRPPDVSIRRPVSVGAPLKLQKSSAEESSLVMNPLKFKNRGPRFAG